MIKIASNCSITFYPFNCNFFNYKHVSNLPSNVTNLKKFAKILTLVSCDWIPGLFFLMFKSLFHSLRVRWHTWNGQRIVGKDAFGNLFCQSIDIGMTVQHTIYFFAIPTNEWCMQSNEDFFSFSILHLNLRQELMAGFAEWCYQRYLRGAAYCLWGRLKTCSYVVPVRTST